MAVRRRPSPAAELSRPNWLDFTEARDAKQAFDALLARLVDAIETDIGWVRQHTELTARTERWKDAGRPADQFLLSGIEISNAQHWLSRCPEKGRISEDFHEFLRASLAKEERAREELNARERRISQEIQRLIGEAARRAREAHRHDRAMRLALAGEPSEEALARGIAPEPSRRAQLAAAAHSARGIVSLGHSEGVTCAAFSVDGTRVLTISGDSARVWSATSGTELFRLGHDGIVNTARFSANGARVVTASDDNTARVWDASTGTELARLRHDGTVRSAVFSADSARVVTASTDKTSRVWDAGSETNALVFYA